METKGGISGPKRTKQRGQMRTAKLIQTPLNGMLNTVAKIKVARLYHGQSVHGRVAMEYVDNNAYEIQANPEGADYDLWDGCFM